MEQADKDDDEEVRARLEVLREEMKGGRVKFSTDLPLVMDSLKAVRYRPDGKVDLSTVDSRVRSLANMVSQFRYRREAKEAVSLQDLQRSYFTYIERNFGELYASMKDRGADPSKVGDAMASNPDAVKGFKKGMPEFLELVDDLWKQTWDSAYYHVQDLEGLKAVFGGETFPSARKNIVSVSGVYPGAAASLQRRCVSSLQCRHSRRRPCHGLHDQEQVSTVSGLPGVFQARPRGRTCRRGAAAQHRTGNRAQASPRQATQTQEAGKTRQDLTATRLALLTLSRQLERC